MVNRVFRLLYLRKNVIIVLPTTRRAKARRRGVAKGYLRTPVKSVIFLMTVNVRGTCRQGARREEVRLRLPNKGNVSTIATGTGNYTGALENKGVLGMCQFRVARRNSTPNIRLFSMIFRETTPFSFRRATRMNRIFFRNNSSFLNFQDKIIIAFW